MKPRGFTLLEVLTALVVVGVLAAIAIPSWRSHLLRTRRAEAMNALLAVQRAEDEHFGRNGLYAAGPAALGLPATTEHGAYALQITTSDDGLAYVASARALAASGQADDARCAEFRIDHNGQRRAFGADGVERSPDCWR